MRQRVIAWATVLALAILGSVAQVAEALPTPVCIPGWGC